MMGDGRPPGGAGGEKEEEKEGRTSRLRERGSGNRSLVSRSRVSGGSGGWESWNPFWLRVARYLEL